MTWAEQCFTLLPTHHPAAPIQTYPNWDISHSNQMCDNQSSDDRLAKTINPLARTHRLSVSIFPLKYRHITIIYIFRSHVSLLEYLYCLLQTARRIAAMPSCLWCDQFGPIVAIRYHCATTAPPHRRWLTGFTSVRESSSLKFNLLVKKRQLKKISS